MGCLIFDNILTFISRSHDEICGLENVEPETIDSRLHKSGTYLEMETPES